jgi:hypothetical protein
MYHKIQVFPGKTGFLPENVIFCGSKCNHLECRWVSFFIKSDKNGVFFFQNSVTKIADILEETCRFNLVLKKTCVEPCFRSTQNWLLLHNLLGVTSLHHHTTLTKTQLHSPHTKRRNMKKCSTEKVASQNMFILLMLIS